MDDQAAAFSRTTTKSAYRLDVAQFTRHVIQAREEVFAQTAAWACSVRVHPLDHAQIRVWLPPVDVDAVYRFAYEPSFEADRRDRFLGLWMVENRGVEPGMATVEVCRECATRQPHGACGRSRIAPAPSAVPVGLLGQAARASLAATSERLFADERETPGANSSAPKRTRRASRAELERRAATAERKAAEAGEKAKRARNNLGEFDSG